MKTRWLIRYCLLAILVYSLPLIAMAQSFNPVPHTHPHIGSSVHRVTYSGSDAQATAKMLRKAAISFHNHLLETNYGDGFLILETDETVLTKLEEFGFTAVPAPEWIEQYERHQKEVQEAIQQRQRGVIESSTGIPTYPCYETVEETFAEAETLVSTYPTLATWNDIGDSWEKVNGLGGYDLMVLKITNSAITGGKPKLFVNTALHAREYTTAPLSLYFAKQLLNRYGQDADSTWVVDHHEIHLLLQANPDGRKQAEADIFWRKNANQNYCSPTSIYRGADLNRNFTFFWNITNGTGSSGSQCNITYRGPSAASEPEVQAIETYLRQIFSDKRGEGMEDAAPDDTSGIHLDIHSYSELVLWPYGHRETPAPNGTQLQTLGRKFAYWNNYFPEQSIGLYPTDGTSDSISYGELGVPAYTFELGTSFFQSCSVYTNTILPNNLPALMYAAKVVRTPYITPSGPDAFDLFVNSGDGVSAGTPVTLSATISDTRYNNTNGTEPSQAIQTAEVYVDTPYWENTPVAITMAASDGNFDSTTEDVYANLDTTAWEVGKHLVYVRGQDTDGNWGAISAIYIVIVP